MKNATWPVAAGSLLAGFGVAEATGVRALGGVVLVAGASWCALRWRQSAGGARTVALLLVYLGTFVGAHLHVMRDTVGPWPTVLIAAAVTGFAVWALADAAVGRSAAATA